MSDATPEPDDVASGDKSVTDTPTTSLRDRVRENPRPATVWLAGALVLILLEAARMLGWIVAVGSMIRFVVTSMAGLPTWVGGNVESVLGGIAGTVTTVLVTVAVLFAVASLLVGILPIRLTRLYDVELPRSKRLTLERGIWTGLFTALAGLLVLTPAGSAFGTVLDVTAETLVAISNQVHTITSREIIPNQGHRTPDGGWEGTFLGLSPAQAWAIRVAVVYAYATAWLVWLWKGYNIFREHYREADWTPRDDTLRRFRHHYWGLFGFTIIFMFVVLAVWAPSVSTVPLEHNVVQPCQHEHTYLDDNNQVSSILHCDANLATRSTGGDGNIGPNSYDQFDRYAPLGTTPRGQDLLTNLAYGARTSLIIGLTGIGGAALIAVVMSLLTAYYKGLTDLLTIIASDTIIAVPVFLLIMLLSVIFRQGGHPVAEPLDGGLLLALIFAFAFWPGLWRSIRGPSLQVAEQDWVDAARSYGQTPAVIMRKHMAPYVFGYIMIYASLLLGSAIIITAALSFLGLGIQPPTPEWGRIIDSGQPYIATSSWHVSTISGIMIVLVVTAFQALGDGIRDAIDPEADIDQGDAAAAGGGG